MKLLAVLCYIYFTLKRETVASSVYNIDDSVGLGKRFDGIGGLSGGSATSKLLKAYPDKQRNQVLDILFKPNFAASLQILKVEIGGDSESSDATEASHMHNSWDEDYNRGYEWWMMAEAKKRNPSIKLYGLPWNFPGWIGNGTQNPYNNVDVLATYIRKWIQGARDVHNLTIDYIGIWNERACNTTYIKRLRRDLDKHGFSHVGIVAGDNGAWGIENDILKDADLASAVDVIGVHYPRKATPVAALKTGKLLWASEDYSAFNNARGGGIWARALNENYVDRYLTSTIAWNLIDCYYEGLTWDRDSLMTARQPWSGNYIIESPIWMSGHTTQFTKIGWKYLAHGSGVGPLAQGGTYVSLVSPDTKDLSIIIETMTLNHSLCTRDARCSPRPVGPQTITLHIGGSFAAVSQLNVWYSKLGFDGKQSVYFKHLDPLKVTHGVASISVGLDEVYSLTTLNTGHKGDFGQPPQAKSFPLPYVEDFDDYPEHAEPLLLAQQNGAFEVISADSSNVMRQMVIETPIVWCQTNFDHYTATMNVIGSADWSDIYIESEVRVGRVNGTHGIYIAAHINNTGCTYFKARGIFFFIFPVSRSYSVSADIERQHIYDEGAAPQLSQYGWNKMSLLAQGSHAVGYINGQVVFNLTVAAEPARGFVAVGTDVFGIADFDNLKLASSMAEADQVRGKSSRYYNSLLETHSSRSSDEKLNFRPGFQ
ncbi:galactocerebrosidase-like isoform X2 [Haliotis rufescens]|uniref:galactocerebrosidase-like isoform X1 n=1 Tax=Haliotis rufescens TaxID=6454 RepID=UPI00201F0215|nr:galactocerebrosidase-like isoform X1 [Haliotis rufescens]XP_048252967.1 galactocerebrosidase-like isoform X2 [Haliotis rufescens]